MTVNFQNYINAKQFSDLGNIIGFDEKTGMQGIVPPALTGGRSLGEMAVRGAAMQGLGEGGSFSNAISGAVAPFKNAFQSAKTSMGEMTSKLPSFDYSSALGKIEME